MTRDGFNLIAMDFTGSRAMQHKIEFIYAFNILEGEVMTTGIAGGLIKAP
jgi:phage regulator Rha-like protein